jgi:TPR repeat protein
MKRFTGLCLLAGGFALTSCGGGAGNTLRPGDYKGTDALDAAAPKCEGAPKFARPLTVDLDSDTRSDLEASMKGGVVVVAYDCVSLKVLDSCKPASGEYAYAGTSLKEEVVSMKGLDELQVNLPLGAASLSSEVKAGRTIDLALVSVGRRTAGLSGVKRSELTGGCEGATHFLQKAFVGAFSMATGSAGKIAAVADIFAYSGSGASESERSAARKDGSLEACHTSDPDADKPPAQCRSPLRVELIPIVDDLAKEPAPAPPPPAAAGVAAAENPCRDGYKLVGGLCSKKLDAAYQCDPKNEGECQAQCEKGNAVSCVNAGAFIANQYWKITVPVANERSRPYFKKACEAGNQDGCAGYVRATFPSEKEAKNQVALAKELIAVDKKACEAGATMACFDLGTFHGQVYAGQPYTDVKASLRYFERACMLGHPDGCNTAGLLHMSSDPAKGLALYQRGCDGGDGFVCNQLAMRLITGMDGTTKDLPRGEQLAKRACDLNIENCGFTGELFEDANKPTEGVEYARKGCEGKDTRAGLDEGDRGRALQYRGGACVTLGKFYKAGVGVKQDPKKAKDIFKKACDLGYGPGCTFAKE